MPRLACLAVLCWWMASCCAPTLPAQQVTSGGSLQGVGSSFSEHSGTSWGFRSGGMNFQFGGALPSGGANWGFSVLRPGFSGFFNGAWGQSSQQTFSTQSASVTSLNGYPGYMTDVTVTPFVIGSIPVRGDYFVGGFPIVGTFAPYGPGGTTVQLPTLSTFETGITVWVPSGGAANLGMIGRAAEGAAQVGAPGLRGNVARGGNVGVAGAQVNAVVHDLQAMDEAIQAQGRAGGNAPASQQQAAAAADASSAAQPAMSVAQARRLHEAETRAAADEAQSWFDRGVTAEEEGKPGVAKLYYQMAARQASGELKQKAQEKVAKLSAAGKTADNRR